jgi:Uma2 family endonuclease
MAIDVEVSRRLFTVDEYHRMAEAGIFHPDERVELIEGEIVEMSPIGPRHAGCVINATRLFITRLGDRIVLSPQNPVVIRPRSEPQPDLLLLRPRTISYSREHPTPEDVALAVEVADTTVRFDRVVKARLYARARIAEFWLLLPNDMTVEIHRAPGPDGYGRVTQHGFDQTVSALVFPDVGFAVSDFFA